MLNLKFILFSFLIIIILGGCTESKKIDIEKSRELKIDIYFKSIDLDEIESTKSNFRQITDLYKHINNKYFAPTVTFININTEERFEFKSNPTEKLDAIPKFFGAKTYSNYKKIIDENFPSKKIESLIKKSQNQKESLSLESLNLKKNQKLILFSTNQNPTNEKYVSFNNLEKMKKYIEKTIRNAPDTDFKILWNINLTEIVPTKNHLKLDLAVFSEIDPIKRKVVIEKIKSVLYNYHSAEIKLNNSTNSLTNLINYNDYNDFIKKIDKFIIDSKNCDWNQSKFLLSSIIPNSVTKKDTTAVFLVGTISSYREELIFRVDKLKRNNSVKLYLDIKPIEVEAILTNTFRDLIEFEVMR